MPKKRRSRFVRLEDSLSHRKNPPRNASAVAYYIGMKKYGKAGMAKKAAAGRRKHRRRRKK